MTQCRRGSGDAATAPTADDVRRALPAVRRLACVTPVVGDHGGGRDLLLKAETLMPLSTAADSHPEGARILRAYAAAAPGREAERQQSARGQCDTLAAGSSRSWLPIRV